MRLTEIIGKATTFLLTLLVAAGGLAAQPAPPGNATKPATTDDVLTLSQIREQQFMLSLLVNPTMELGDRRQAVVSLLDRANAEVDARLIDLLSSNADAVVQRAVAQGLAAAIGQPSDAFAPVLFKLLGTAEEPLSEDIAAALGRYSNHAVARQVEAAALDPNAANVLRHGAIRTLVYHRSKSATATLMSLVNSNRPQDVRDEAFDALAQLTGVSEYGRDLLRWQRWWREYQRLPDSEWYARIINNVEARNRRLKEDALATLARFIESQRQLYRATPQADRQAALIDMLSDKQPVALRQLGMDLTLQFRVDGGQIGKDLIGAVVKRLDDTTPALRANAAKLLLGLTEASGAEAVAVRLNGVGESDPAVLKAFLALLAKLPRADATGPILDLLGQPGLRADAATALAAAVDAGVLEKPVAERALVRLRQQFTDDKPPEPQLIVLLGRIGSDEDWQRIEAWLSAGDDQVKAAAARAWSESASRSLATLARKADDPVILPLLISGAARRGGDEVTFNALVEHAPPEDQTQLYAAWRQAILKIAQPAAPQPAPPPMPPRVFVDADTTLERRGVSPQFRVQILSIVIDRVAAELAKNPRDPLAAQLAPLLLARADAKLDGGDTASVQPDLTRLGTITEPALNPLQVRQRSLLTIRMNLALDHEDVALGEAERLLGPANGPGRTEAVMSAVAELYLVAASRQIDKSPDKARGLVDALSTLLAANTPEPIAEQIRQMQSRIRSTPSK